MTAAEIELKELIADILEDAIRPLLPTKFGTYKLTFLGAIPGEPESDIIVTEDVDESIKGVVARRFP